jgi:DNA-binding NarL/FixJ family response regulator
VISIEPRDACLLAASPPPSTTRGGRIDVSGWPPTTGDDRSSGLPWRVGAIDASGGFHQNGAMPTSPPRSAPIRVLVVEDEPELLHRFSEAVLGDDALTLAAAVSNGASAIAVLGAIAVDVLLLDLGLPDMHGIEVIRHVSQHHPDCDVLVVTMFGDDEHVFAALEAGATGYLLKDAGHERIAASIHELQAGGAPITPSLARRVLARLRSHSPARDELPGPSASTPVLTPREVELLKLTAKGLSFEKVGELLGISPHTVVAHVKKIYRKLAVHSRGEAVYEATQLGLL